MNRIEHVINNLPAGPVTEGTIRLHCEVYIERQPVNDENIRGYFMAWNDYRSGCDTNEIDNDTMTLSEFRSWLPSFIEIDTDYLAEEVMDALEEQGRYTRPQPQG